MEENDTSTSSAQPFNETFTDSITRSSSPTSEISTSAKSNIEIYDNPTSKKAKFGRKGGSKKRSWVCNYFEEKKVIKTIQQLDKKVNVEVTYAICLVLNNSDQECKSQLKLTGGSTSNLISHLSNIHGITKDGPKLSEHDDDAINIVLIILTVSTASEACKDARRLKQIQLTEDEWDLMKDLVVILVLSMKPQRSLVVRNIINTPTNTANMRHKIKNALYSALLHYWNLSDDEVFLACLLDPRCKKLRFATISQRCEAEAALHTKYNDAKSLYQSSTTLSTKSFSPNEDQNNQGSQVYQKSFLKTVFIQDISNESNDE
ncbi:7011_t:CDS:2, partial [Cetraspora pellucida]